MFCPYLHNGIPIGGNTPGCFTKRDALALVLQFNCIIKENAVGFHHALEMSPDEIIGWIIVGKAKIKPANIHIHQRILVFKGF